MNDTIETLARSIAQHFQPVYIYLISRKQNLYGQTTSFKLCIVVTDGDSHAIEHDIYVAHDCPVPFDVVVYTAKEWEAMADTAHSFASHIQESGVLLYEQAQ